MNQLAEKYSALLEEHLEGDLLTWFHKLGNWGDFVDIHDAMLWIEEEITHSLSFVAWENLPDISKRGQVLATKLSNLLSWAMKKRQLERELEDFVREARSVLWELICNTDKGGKV